MLSSGIGADRVNNHDDRPVQALALLIAPQGWHLLDAERRPALPPHGSATADG